MSKTEIDVRANLEQIEAEEASKEVLEIDEEIVEEDISDVEEFSETQLEAMDLGWNPEGKDRDGNSLSAEEFLARKPLFNKIRNQGDELAQMKQMLEELRNDNRKIAEASIKEKDRLLEQLKEAREAALEDLDVDTVKQLDKKIEDTQELIKESKVEKGTETKVSPYYNDFLKENEWAKDESSSLYMAALGLGQRYMMTHEIVDGNDKPMFDYIHKKIREDFPERFKEKPKVQRVASSKNRATGNYSKKKQVTLSDLPEEERRIVKVMMDATGKTEEEYLKNYEL